MTDYDAVVGAFSDAGPVDILVNNAGNAGRAATMGFEDMAPLAKTEPADWEPFIKTLENNWNGILAYFNERRNSGAVEGLNTKMRVITRRSYGIRNIGTLWTRALLDVNWAAKKVGQSIPAIRELVGRIRGHFNRCYT